MFLDRDAGFLPQKYRKNIGFVYNTFDFLISVMLKKRIAKRIYGILFLGIVMRMNYALFTGKILSGHF